MRYLAITLALLGAVAAADEPTKADVRKLAKWSKLDTPWEHLALADGVEIGEGTRGMRDVFPYWVAKQGGVTYAVTPKNISHFLKKKDGAAVTNAAGALELVRAFVPGVLVDLNKTASAVVGESRKLKAEGNDITVHDYRPKSYTYMAGRDGKRWNVSMVALEIEGRLRLVHVTAKVDHDGAVAFAHEPIVDGPALTWQTEGDVDVEAEREARERVHEAMLRCAEIAAPVATLDAAWVLARTLDRLTDVKRVFGKPTKEWGKTARMMEYAVSERSKVTFNGPAGADRIDFAGHVRMVSSGASIATMIETFRQR